MKRTNDQPLKDVLARLVRREGMRHPLLEVRIREIWHQDMGDYINRYTRFLRLKGGVLEIGITSSGLRDELHYSKTKITSFLNERLGEEVIQDVVIRS